MALKVDSRVGRAVQAMGRAPWFLKVAPAFIPRVDRWVARASRGRFLLSSGMVPSLVLTVTGARSGRSYDVPLATVPDGDAFLVVGSNFGRVAHPAWTANLLKNPDAIVTYRARRVPVRGRLLDPEQKAAAWPRLTAVWPNYDSYVEKSGGRDLRVFRLEPSGEPTRYAGPRHQSDLRSAQ